MRGGAWSRDSSEDVKGRVIVSTMFICLINKDGSRNESDGERTDRGDMTIAILLSTEKNIK